MDPARLRRREGHGGQVHGYVWLAFVLPIALYIAYRLLVALLDSWPFIVAHFRRRAHPPSVNAPIVGDPLVDIELPRFPYMDIALYLLAMCFLSYHVDWR